MAFKSFSSIEINALMNEMHSENKTFIIILYAQYITVCN